jgi:NADH-quinone oxidoreductase subunit F
MEFYEHESCGKCTPCREGTYWLAHILRRIETGKGRMEDLALLESVTTNMVGKTLCVLADFAAGPLTSSLRWFREDYVAHVVNEGCPSRSVAAGAGS